VLRHNPNGLPNGDTDEETIQRKKARIAIARVDQEEGAQLVDRRFSPQVQPDHFHPRPAHQDEALGSPNKPP